MATFPKADTNAQWYQDNYPGSTMNLTAATAVVCLHTTEGGDWPGYSGGSMAPNYTAKPDPAARRLRWRAHFPDEKSSRALRNLSGGVETNTLNVVQVEMVGTCVRGGPGMFWPEAPEWALAGIAEFLRYMNDRHGLQLRAPKMWLAYGKDDRRPGITPASYGASPARMSFAEWRNFAGVCGHQHVPENVHGDPGRLNIDRILALAKGTQEDDMTPEDFDKIKAAIADEGAKTRTMIQNLVGDVVDSDPTLWGDPADNKKVYVRTALARILDRLGKEQSQP